MSERRTTIELGTDGGMSDYGRKTPADRSEPSASMATAMVADADGRAQC